MATDTKSPKQLDDLCVNTLRFLAVDEVQKANSGHPGMPMGAAAMAYVLWDRFLKVDPAHPEWPDRDRFVLSAGHGCALLYALLHLTGYDLSLEDLKNFRQWGSRTPGHPEYGHTVGVDVTTGPLGQGMANAVGMAIAEQAAAARYNQSGQTIVDHHTFVIASDGDMMEGVSSEAASLAGHLKLGKLVVLYDDNRISIEGKTELAFTEDVVARFQAYGWRAERVEDGNDYAAIDAALKRATSQSTQPSLIAVRTHIGFGSPKKQDTSSAHGEPLGADEVLAAKKKLGWPESPTFLVPPEVQAHMRKKLVSGQREREAWLGRVKELQTAAPKLAEEFQRSQEGKLPEALDKSIPFFDGSTPSMATRDASGVVINQIAKLVPEFIGGSADLAPSTKTLIKDGGAFAPESRGGRNLHFGVREHAMGSILNGIAVHKGFAVFGSTFLIFSDYMRPPMRLASMNGLPVTYVFTHDSVALGEDGPTHQPIEQLLGLRSVEGLYVIRPADANETRAAWLFALSYRKHPTAIVLTRQKLPVLTTAQHPSVTSGPARGGYVLADAPSGKKATLVLVATGSEVSLALECQKQLSGENLFVRVVSMPCVRAFMDQPLAYRNEVLPPHLPQLPIEAGLSLGWRSYFENNEYCAAIDHYGASADGELLMKKFGFTPEAVCAKARALAERK